MNRVQDYLRNLFEAMEQNQFFPDEGRGALIQIKERLLGSTDLEAELRTLYRVQDLAPFATALMWVTRRAEAESLRTAPTEEEQDLVLSKFLGAALQAPAPAVDGPEIEAGSQEFPAETVQAVEEPAPVGAGEEGAVAAAEGPQEFTSLMERFAEVVQSGDESRSEQSVQILNLSQRIAAEGSGYDEDLRQFCGLFSEFLMYVTANQLMDDVRVMNIMSNISGPVSSWGAAAEGERTGLLTEGIEVLKHFKSMFE